MPLDQLFQLWFLPFLLTFVILFGVLSALKIFGKKFNLVIALILSFAAALSGVLSLFATFLIPLTGQIVVISFLLIFIVGVVMWAFGKGSEIYYEQVPDKKIEKLNKQIAKNLKKAKKALEAGDKEKALRYQAEVEKLEKELELLRLKRR
jgi:ABC-type multidrug transport system fused ATPase/permease subunit